MRKTLDVRAVVGEEDPLTRMEELKRSMFKEYISGELDGFMLSPTESMGLPPVVSCITASVSAHNPSCSSE